MNNPSEPEIVVTPSLTMRVNTGCGSMYVTLRFGPEGKFVGVLARLGRSGGCASLNSEVICGLITECLRVGVDAGRVTKCLMGTQCHMTNHQAGILSCADAFGKAIARGLELQASGEMAIQVERSE